MEVTSTEVQNNFGTYLKLTQFEEVVITRSGKPVAILKVYEEPGAGGDSVAEKAAAYGSESHNISYEEFIKLSEASEGRYEYIDGEVYLLASPSYSHQRIIMELSSTMYLWFKGKSCRPLTSPFDVTLLKNDNKNVVQPDIIVVCDTENVNDKGRYTGTPSLVVEVLSDSTRSKDMLKKLDLYTHSGVREYWVVNPGNKEVYIYTIEDCGIKDYRAFKGSETAKSAVFEGLGIALDQLFAL